MKKIILLFIMGITLNGFSQIPTDSLVAYYPFNGNANDESGNGNDGTVNGASLVKDRFGIPDNAYRFDGIDDNIDVSYQFGNEYELEYSISLWIKADSIQNYYAKVFCFPQQESTWNEPYHYLALNYYNPDIGIQQFEVAYFDQFGTLSVVNTQDVQPNVWQHLLFTFNNGQVKIYVNNELVSSGTFLDYANIFFPDHGFSIGSATFNDLVNREFFTGVIDDIRIYNKVLSSSEIESCFKEGDYISSISRYRQFKFLPLPLDGFQYIRFESYYSEDREQVNVYEIEAFYEGINEALNKSTYANSSNGSLTKYAVDNNQSSRWSSDRNDNGPDYVNPHYIVVDLEQKFALDSINLNIEGFDSWNQTFSLLASPDSINWYLIGNGDDTTGIFNYNTNIEKLVTVYDTTFTDVYDTTFTDVYDTTFTDVFDTTYVPIYDTTHVTVYDTAYVSVSDTLIIDAVLTGIDPPNNTNPLKVYPNPAKEYLIINTGEYERMNSYSIKIMNQSGQTVYETNIEEPIYEINLSSWTGNGLYFLQLFDDAGNMIEVKKIIIQ